MPPTFAPPSVSVMRSAVPRFSKCDHVAPGWTISSNRKSPSLIGILLFFGYAASTVQLLREDNRFGELLHRAAQPAAFISQSQVGFLFGHPVPVLKDPLRTLDDFAHFEEPFHLQRL